MWNRSHPLKYWLTHAHCPELTTNFTMNGAQRASLCLTIEWEMTALAQIFKSFSEDPEKVTAPWTNLPLNNDAIWFLCVFSVVGWKTPVVNLTQRSHSLGPLPLAVSFSRWKTWMYCICVAQKDRGSVHVCVQRCTFGCRRMHQSQEGRQLTLD